MVHCVVVNCSQRSPRNTKKGISCHRFPLKDESQLSEWLAEIKRENMPPLENCHICSAHFAPSCFEDDIIRSKVMPESARKRDLKDDAIPTVFAHKKRTTQRPASERRKRKVNHVESRYMLCIENLEQLSIYCELPINFF